MHVPIDFALYLPKPWLDSSARRNAARIPKETPFKTKPELALDLVARALENDVAGEVVLADAAYGSSAEFCDGLVAHGLDYAVRIDAPTKIWPVDARGRPGAEAVSVMDLGLRIDRKGSLHLRRVVVAHDDDRPLDSPHRVWLVIESPQDEDRPTEFTLTTLEESKRSSERISALAALKLRLQPGGRGLKTRRGSRRRPCPNRQASQPAPAQGRRSPDASPAC